MPAPPRRPSARSSSIWASRSATAIRRWSPAPIPRNSTACKAGWIAKKLGVDDAKTADGVLEKVCKAMAADHTKNRVTFYYLVAKELGKLGAL